MTHEQSPITIKTIDHPHLTISGIPHPIAPKTLACPPKAPVAISGAAHALIEREKKLRSPVLNTAMPPAQKPLNRRGTNRHNVADVQTKTKPNRAQLRSTVNKPRQQTSQLEPIDQQIIRPLNSNWKIMLFQPFSHRQRHSKPEQAGLRRRTGAPWQRCTDPYPTFWGGPNPPPLAISTNLMTSQYGPWLLEPWRLNQPAAQQRLST